MSRIDPVFVTWRQFGEIFWICTLAGVIVGTPIYLAHLFSGFGREMVWAIRGWPSCCLR